MLGLSILTTSGAISGNGKLTLELLVFHYSNSSGALFFTLLMALPSGRSWSTTLVGRIARIGLAVFPEAAARTKRAGSGNHVVLRLFVEHDEGSAIRRIKRAKPLTSHYLTELVLGVQRKVSGREGRQDRVMGSKRSRRGQPATGGPFRPCNRSTDGERGPISILERSRHGQVAMAESCPQGASELQHALITVRRVLT